VRAGIVRIVKIDRALLGKWIIEARRLDERLVIAVLDAAEKPADFAALEVQSVYISGKSVRPAFNSFLATGVDVMTALREGEAPQQDDIPREIEGRFAKLPTYDT